MFHPMTNRQWVTLIFYFSKQYHQSLCLILWPIGSEWHWFISLPGNLINHVSSYDKQNVSDTGLFLCQAVSSMSHPIPNSMWVTLVYFFARQPHQSYDQQTVSDTDLFICQAASSTMSHPMTNRKWAVTLVYLFARQSHQSCLFLWPESEWHWFISLPGSLSLINHLSPYDQQSVSGTGLFLCQAVSSIISHPMTNSVGEWHWFISLPGSLINHLSSYDQQNVSDTGLFLCQAVSFNHLSTHDQQHVSDTGLFLCQAASLIISHPMATGSEQWLVYFFARQSHQSCLHHMTNRQWVTPTCGLFIWQAVSSIM